MPSKLGLKTVAVGRGKDNAALARQLGAAVYLDAAVVNPAEEPNDWAAPGRSGDRAGQQSDRIDGRRLGANGTLLIVAAPGEPVMVNAITLIGKRASVQGPSGTAKDSEDTLGFSAMTGVRP